MLSKKLELPKTISDSNPYPPAVAFTVTAGDRAAQTRGFIAGSSQLIDYFEGYIVFWEAFGRFMLTRTK